VPWPERVRALLVNPFSIPFPLPRPAASIGLFSEHHKLMSSINSCFQFSSQTGRSAGPNADRAFGHGST
jgi:hypothetical protein